VHWLPPPASQIIAAPVVLWRRRPNHSERKDYSVRARKFSEDELGVLTDAFNQMLRQVQERDRALPNRSMMNLKNACGSAPKTSKQLQRQNALILHSAVKAFMAWTSPDTPPSQSGGRQK